MLSVSCDLWINMHKFEMHYIACSNKKIEYNWESEEENSHFQEYFSLYSNGHIHSVDEIKNINIKFPEIKDFYYDYILNK